LQGYDALDDTQLARLAKDDHDAFDVLYRRHVTSVYRYCYARTDSVVDAEDLTTQTFLAVLEAIGRYRERGSFSAWLFGIARRKCADFYRARYADRSDPVAYIEAIMDKGADDPEESLMRAAVLDCVARMLAQLSPDRREALHFRYWGDLSMRDVATVMQRSEGAVKMLVSRAISDLRERCVK